MRRIGSLNTSQLFALLLAVIGTIVSCARAAGDEPPAQPVAEPLPAKRPGASGQRLIIQKNVMIAMRDGVKLSTDLYRPAEAGKHPVVLIRTPYGSETTVYAERGAYYAGRGYVLAVQDVRGKGDSEGEWYGKRDEGADGDDTITWLGRQSWSTGKVGMTGPSYGGMVQYLVAGSGNPYLKALVPLVGPLTLGRDTTDFDHLAVYANRETASTYEIQWMTRVDGRVSQVDPAYTVNSARDHLPMSEYPRIVGRDMPWLPFLVNHRYGFWEEYFRRAAAGEWRAPMQDGAWWADYEARYRKVNVPILHISGWYDCCVEAPIKNFQSIRKLATEPLARDNQQLMLGPWVHSVGTSKIGEIEFGPAARMNPDSVAIEWFDRWLKDEQNGVETKPAVRVFVMGANRWREAADWPIPGTRFTNFYLHSSGDARLTTGGGTLSTDLPETEPADRYTYDPAHPTPESLTDTSGVPAGPSDRTALEKRDDVLVYTSAALREPLEVTGSLSAVLYASTSAPSTDFFVRLIDVHPDGKAYNVFQTYATAPFRSHWAKTVTTGTNGERIVKAEIWLPPTSVLFGVGHRIRVEISSATAPAFRGLNVEPGTELKATQWNVAHQVIYHDREHPSHMVLPVIPR